MLSFKMLIVKFFLKKVFSVPTLRVLYTRSKAKQSRIP